MPDVTTDSTDVSKSPGEDLFIDIWDNLATRSTTKREDLHGIFAVMLGLSAQEILSRKSPEERMQAVLRVQDSLPLSMLYDSYPDNTPLSEDYRLVPHFPAGTLSTDFGNMTWTSDGSGLQFKLPDAASVTFTTDPDMKFGGESVFNLVITPPQICKSIRVFVRLKPSGGSLPRRIQSGERLVLSCIKSWRRLLGPGRVSRYQGEMGQGICLFSLSALWCMDGWLFRHLMKPKHPSPLFTQLMRLSRNTGMQNAF